MAKIEKKNPNIWSHCKSDRLASLKNVARAEAGDVVLDELDEENGAKLSKGENAVHGFGVIM